ncbi:MAG: hypothetical protein M3436_08290 [Pseudomonadota bacterium]|nr:hypothetical protein [Pseudomonadota bacterium]
MEAEQRIVVGGHILRQGVLDEGVIEHPTHGNPINVSTRNAKTDDPSREDINYYHDPIALQQD